MEIGQENTLAHSVHFGRLQHALLAFRPHSKKPGTVTTTVNSFEEVSRIEDGKIRHILAGRSG